MNIFGKKTGIRRHGYANHHYNMRLIRNFRNRRVVLCRYRRITEIFAQAALFKHHIIFDTPLRYPITAWRPCFRRFGDFILIENLTVNEAAQ